MKTHKISIIMPKCNECDSPMKFYDDAWIETPEVAVICLLCTNKDCCNVSVIHIDLWPPDYDTVSPTAGTR